MIGIVPPLCRVFSRQNNMVWESIQAGQAQSRAKDRSWSRRQAYFARTPRLGTLDAVAANHYEPDPRADRIAVISVAARLR